MLRLSTVCALLAAVLAQNGYEYNKPGQAFPPGLSVNRPGYPPGPTTSPYTPQSQDHSAPGTTPNYSTSGSNYPSSNQGYNSQSSFAGLGQTGPTGPSSYPGQQGTSLPGQGSISPGYGSASPGFVPSSTGISPGSSGFGPSSPGLSQSSNFDSGAYEGGDYSAIPGEPDKDYPILSVIPETSFRCEAQPYPGYYADVEARCQVFHVCANNITYDFLCPNGTIFSQEFFVCVWWNQFDCNSAPSFFELNANLYDYSIIGSQNSNNYAQGQQNAGSYSGSQGSYPGNTASYPGSPNLTGISGPSNYPGSGPTTLPTYPGSTGPQQTSYSGTGPQGSSNYPGSSPQGPSNYPGVSTQGPSGYPGSSPQGHSNYPGTSPQGSPTYPGSSPQGSSSYPGSTPQESSRYPGSSSQGPSSYPVSSPQGPSNYQGSSPQGHNNYSGASPQGPNNYSGASPQAPSSYSSSENSQGYPLPGKPSGPSFSTLPRPQQPNREYLPPKN